MNPTTQTRPTTISDRDLFRTFFGTIAPTSILRNVRDAKLLVSADLHVLIASGLGSKSRDVRELPEDLSRSAIRSRLSRFLFEADVRRLVDHIFDVTLEAFRADSFFGPLEDPEDAIREAVRQTAHEWLRPWTEDEVSAGLLEILTRPDRELSAAA